MAKAGLLFVGTNDGIVLYSQPGAAGRWLRIGQELRSESIQSVWTWTDDPTVVLVATDTRLLRSGDGGTSWQPVSSVAGGLLAGSKANSALVTCLAVDGAVLQSSDAGATWMQVGRLEIAHAADSRVLIAGPDDARILYGALANQVHISVDGGSSWNPLGRLPDPITSLAVLAQRASLYAQANGRLYQYSGVWQAIGSPQRLSGPLVALAGREPTLLAALDTGEVGRSNDGGQSWDAAGAEMSWPSGPHVLVAVPYHMDMAFAGGGSTVALSVDRGQTWQRLKGEASNVRAIAVARLI